MWQSHGWEPAPPERWVTTCQGSGSGVFLQSGRGRPTEEERIGHSTSKIPPFWEPSLELRGYPFRVWIQDLDVWAAGTELAAELQAPAVVQRLGGAARELIRAVPTQELREGRLDPTTGAIDSGLTILVRGLTRRFGQFAIETSTRCIIDLLGFRRRQVESIDEALARFETLRGQLGECRFFFGGQCSRGPVL